MAYGSYLSSGAGMSRDYQKNKLQLLVVTYPGVEQKQWVGRQLGTQNGSSELRPLPPKRVRIS